MTNHHQHHHHPNRKRQIAPGRNFALTSRCFFFCRFHTLDFDRYRERFDSVLLLAPASFAAFVVVEECERERRS